MPAAMMDTRSSPPPRRHRGTAHACHIAARPDLDMHTIDVPQEGLSGFMYSRAVRQNTDTRTRSVRDADFKVCHVKARTDSVQQGPIRFRPKRDVGRPRIHHCPAHHSNQSPCGGRLPACHDLVCASDLLTMYARTFPVPGCGGDHGWVGAGSRGMHDSLYGAPRAPHRGRRTAASAGLPQWGADACCVVHLQLRDAPCGVCAVYRLCCTLMLASVRSAIGNAVCL